MVKQWKKSLDSGDVQAEAEDALEKDISQLSPASNSVAANLDGGVAAVDWSSKTLQTVRAPITISGSGYLISVHVAARSTNGSPDIDVDVTIDGGTQMEVIDMEWSNSGVVFSDSAVFFARFESELKLSSFVNNANKQPIAHYVLD
jgi:hypothetical protein